MPAEGGEASPLTCRWRLQRITEEDTMAATGTERRSYHVERHTLDVPGGGTVTIGMTEEGEIKLSSKGLAYTIESFWAGGPTSARDGCALVLSPIDAD
jgi:hypothetical protein